MKKIIFLNYFILASIMLQSCRLDKFGEWEISELYAQKIEGTSKVIYKYDAWGGRDSHIFGYIILDSTETFNINLDKDLPLMQLSEIPNKNFVKGISHECDNSCGDNYYKSIPKFNPIKLEEFKSEDITIKNLIYQYRGFAEKTKSLRSFQFETFKETRDSLFFYNLNDVESLNGQHMDSLKLKKSEVIIRQNTDLEITKLIIKDIIINHQTNELVLIQPYFLTPKNKLNSNVFSNYGIFKEVIKY